MQVCTSLQTDNHACTPSLSFFTGRVAFLPPNQQRQSTEDIYLLEHSVQFNYNTALLPATDKQIKQQNLYIAV